MINEKNISVIIPMYNAEKSIVNALNSVKDQTAFGYIKEIIVINDGSIDKSCSIVEAYINQYKDINIKMINIENGGVSNARNLGIEISQGKWIALLDSDDEWYESKLQIQVDIINGNDDIDFLGAEYRNIDFKIFLRKINELHKIKAWEMCVRSFPQPSTVLFKKNIFIEIGGFDSNQRYCEDLNYFTKIAHFYNAYHYPYKLVTFDGDRFSKDHTGLSSNSYMMHCGVIKNLKDFKKEKIISKSFFLFIYIFSYIKYIRRLIYLKIQ